MYNKCCLFFPDQTTDDCSAHVVTALGARRLLGLPTRPRQSRGVAGRQQRIPRFKEERSVTRRGGQGKQGSQTTATHQIQGDQKPLWCPALKTRTHAVESKAGGIQHTRASPAWQRAHKPAAEPNRLDQAPIFRAAPQASPLMPAALRLRRRVIANRRSANQHNATEAKKKIK